MYCFLSTDDDSCLPFFLISAGQLYKDSYSDFLDVTATMGLFFFFSLAGPSDSRAGCVVRRVNTTLFRKPILDSLKVWSESWRAGGDMSPVREFIYQHLFVSGRSRRRAAIETTAKTLHRVVLCASNPCRESLLDPRAERARCNLQTGVDLNLQGHELFPAKL